MIKSLDTGSAPNLPVTGWEGMLGQGGADSLQQCAILAHSLMSQQFGGQMRSGDEDMPWDLPLSPMTHGHLPHHDMSHVVTSPVRGAQYHHHQQQQHQHQGYHEAHHGQLSPHHDNMSPVMTPVKMPPSPGHPLSPDHFNQHHQVSSSQNVVSPPKKDGFHDNNPGYFRGHNAHVAAQLSGGGNAPQWAPELAIHPSAPTYDEMSHPPIASSLYGQDLRYNQYY